MIVEIFLIVDQQQNQVRLAQTSLSLQYHTPQRLLLGDA